MRRIQCDGCPNLITHISALRQIAVTGVEFPKDWTRARWYCSDCGIKPISRIPYCALCNGNKGGVHISGRN